MENSIVYALDFDGVICDSAVETAITGWRVAAMIWRDMPSVAPPDLINAFRELRPGIETGYEAILAMRMLYLGESVEVIYGEFNAKVQVLLQQAQLSVEDLKRRFGETRDAWIESDLDDWICMNPLFQGVAEKLQRLNRSSAWYVITTKQERFVKHILKANAIELADERIFGLDRSLTKPDVLKILVKNHSNHGFYFVEDRLPTLQNVQKHQDLARVKLLFATWGYNTLEDKRVAAQQGFRCLQLKDFLC